MNNTLWEDFCDIETLVSQLDTFTSTVDSEIARLDDWRMGHEDNGDENGGVYRECLDYVNRLKYLSQLLHQELGRLLTMIDEVSKKVLDTIRTAKRSNAEIAEANSKLARVLENQ